MSKQILYFMVISVALSNLFGACNSQNEDSEQERVLLEEIDKAIKFQMTDYDSSIFYGQSAYKKAKRTDNFWAQGRAKAIMSRSLFKKGDFIKGYISNLKALRALDDCDTLDFFTRYTVSRNMAVINRSFDQFDSCANYYSRAIDYLDNHIKVYPQVAAEYNDSKLFEKLYFYKAKCSGSAGRYEEAVHLLNEIYENDTIDLYIRINALNDIGALYVRQNDEKSALSYYRKMLQIEGIAKNLAGRAYHNIGNYFFRLQEFDSSINYYNKSLSLREGLKMIDKEIFLVRLDMGEALLRKKYYQESISEFEKALALPRATYLMSENPELKKVFKFLSSAYEAMVPGSGREYMSKFLEQDQNRQIENDKRRFGLEVENYFKDLELKHREESSKRLLTQVIAISILTLTAIGAFYFIKSKKQRNDKKKLFDDIFHQAKI